MDLKQLISDRYSVRAYLSKDVEPSKIDYILECARLAPSAANRQPWFYYIVTTPEAKRKVWEAYPKDWLVDIPLYIVVCKNTDEVWVRSFDGKDSGDIDASITAQHICLAAAQQGLGACWICHFNPDKLAEALELPAGREPVVIFSIGYEDTAKSKEPRKKRKSLSEITKWI